MNTVRSCNCNGCKSVPSKVKGEHKREGARAFRRESKKALRAGDDALPRVSTGYKD